MQTPDVHGIQEILGNNTSVFQSVQQNIIDFNAFISGLVNGNEFAIALILTTTMGVVAYFLRAVPKTLMRLMRRHLTTTVTFTDTSASYHLLIDALHKKGLSNNLRTIRITSGLWSTSPESKKGIGYGRHFLRYRHFLLFIQLHRLESKMQDVSELSITCLGRSHKFIDMLLQDMVEVDEHASDTGYSVYASSSEEFKLWQPKRTFDSIYIPEAEKARIKASLDNFIANRDFYINHGIPYHMGILLQGEPGTGKTSMIKAIASYLNKDIMMIPTVLSFSNACMKDTDKLLVVEEVDTFGTSKRKLKTEADASEPPESGSDKYLNDLGEFSLSLMLQGMDGLLSAQGRIFIMTTNDRDSLDEAFLREGRIDLEIYVTYLDEESFVSMLSAFFADFDIPDFRMLPGVTGSKVQKAILDKLTPPELFLKFTTIKKIQ